MSVEQMNPIAMLSQPEDTAPTQTLFTVLDGSLDKETGPEDPLSFTDRRAEPAAARLAFSLGATLGNPLVEKAQVDPEFDLVGSLMNDVRGLVSGNPDRGPVWTAEAAAAARRDIAARKEALLKTYSTVPEGSPIRGDLAYQWTVLNNMEGSTDDELASVSSVLSTVTDHAISMSGSFLDRDMLDDYYATQVRLDTIDSLADVAMFIGGQAAAVPVLDMELMYEVPMMALPFVSLLSIINTGNVAREILPKDKQSFYQWVFSGAAKEDIAEYLASIQDPEERRRVTRAVKDSLEKYNGAKLLGLPGSDLEKWGTASEIQDNLQEILSYDESVDWTKWVDNVADSLSWLQAAAPAGALLRTMGKNVPRLFGVKATKGTFNAKVLSSMEEGNRARLDALAAETDDALKMLNQTREEAALAMLPKPALPNGQVPRSLSDATAADIDAVATIAQNVAMRPLTSTDLLNSLDNPEALKGQFKSELKAKLGAHVNMALTTLDDVDDITETFRVKAFIGRDANEGFSTAQYALDASARFGMTDAKVYKYDKLDDAFREATETELTSLKMEPGEFYLVHESRMGLGSDFITDLTSFRRKERKSLLSNWATSTMNRYTGKLKELANLHVGREAARAEEMQRVLIPYEQLGRKEKDVVNRLLTQYEGEKWFTTEELLGSVDIGGVPHTLSEAQIAAYKSVQSAMYATHSILNQVERTRLRADGMRWLVADKGETSVGAARQLRDVTEAINAMGSNRYLYVFDPVQQRTIKMAADEVAKEYLNGNQIARLDKPMDSFRGPHKVERTEFVVVRQADGYQFIDLPPTVVRMEQGYLPRITRTPWVVQKEFTVLRNGRESGETDVAYLGGADDYKAAAEFAREHGGVVVPNPLIEGGWSLSSRKALETENAMFYQDRGAKIKGIDTAQPYEDVGSAINRAVHAIASRVETGRLMEKVEGSFLKEFGFAARPGTKAQLVDDLLARGESQEYIQEAVAAWDWITIMKREPTWGQAKINYQLQGVLFRRLAEGQYKNALLKAVLGNKPVREASAIAMKNMPDLTQLTRTVGYVSQILGNPQRQWVVNAPQLVLFSSKNPRHALPAMTLDASYLGMRWQAEKAGIKAKNKLAGAIEGVAGALPTPEYQALFRAFKESGLGDVQAVSVTTENLSGAFSAVQASTSKTMHAVAELGFASAERHNIAAAFSFAARLKSDELGKPMSQFSKKEWQQVVSEGRQYALNMTRADAFNYQRGALVPAMMQYMAVRQKAVQALLSGEEFSGGSQRMLAALNMAVMFGAEGLGVAHSVSMSLAKLGISWDMITEEFNQATGSSVSPEEMRQAIEGGAIDVALNSLGDTLIDKEESSQVEFSKSISPFAENDKIAWTIYNVIQGNMATSDVLALENIPSASAFRRAVQVGQTATMAATTDFKESEVQEVASIARDAMMVFSGASSVVRAFIADGLGMYVDSYGKPIDKLTTFETIGMAFGMTTKDVTDYYAIKEQFGKKYGDSKDDVDEVALAIVREIRLSEDWRESQRKFQQMKLVLNGHELGGTNDIFVSAVRERVMEQLDWRNPANEKLYQNMIRGIEESHGWDSVVKPTDVIGVLRNSKWALENPMKMQELNKMMTDYRKLEEFK